MRRTFGDETSYLSTVSLHPSMSMLSIKISHFTALLLRSFKQVAVWKPVFQLVPLVEGGLGFRVQGLGFKFLSSGPVSSTPMDL